MSPFFPSLIFGVLFVLLLMMGMGAASWTDLRTMRVPKSITMTLLTVGVLMNLVRGVWLGAEGHRVWALEAGVLLGGLDGLLFAVCGLLAGFGIYFILWILGIAGGGDVKLAAAAGSWIGAVNMFWVLLLAMPVLMVLTVVLMGVRVLKGKTAATPPAGLRRGPGWRIVSFSLPMTLGVAALFAIGIFGVRIQMVPN